MPILDKDLVQPSDLQSHSEGTGALRSQIPQYIDYLPPCNNACPAGENIQAWLGLAQEGRYAEAWQKLVEENPLPAVHGRVCYHPCEDHCNRTFIDTPVSIHAVERFLGDKALEEGWEIQMNVPSSGKKVLIVGGGPSGISAAYHLRRAGHEVEIREAGPVLGGMMHFGIPPYRLPRNILDTEIQRIVNLGIKVTLNHKVENLLAEKEAGAFDAVFVAVGAHLSKKVDIPSRDAGQILDALTFLKDTETGNAPKLGRKVAIYGGGNTAMDAARVAKRLGYEPLIIYRRDREHMPAHSFEADEALAEGVKVNWLRTIKEINEQEIKVEVMEVNAEGKPVGTGQFETLEADALILALGQDSDISFLQNISDISFDQDGRVVVGPDMMTGAKGVFAGGDMVPSERTVTVAVGHGKKAARYIDAFLRNTTYQKAPKHPVVGFERLHIWYKTFAPQSPQPQVAEEIRVQDFREVLGGLSEAAARFEAQRCLSCGNCFECDGCYGACPEDAVIKLGKGNRYRFDLTKCTGCAVCFEQCPCHAIEMAPELA
ncbi:MAG: NAD(P)-binding protein [Haliscomenobacter sp.]|uniref:NAD(P)-binding protein n=1 Tax=Haliscomenobacter sp. TaxID=2717303 RepID=UPI0029B0A053|nr:NAD(P)-binding protein [Haliscomenobacter sp.]MDX2069366.1 NAD(P)-binding protein [Haliscomenobacter sp.]